MRSRRWMILICHVLRSSCHPSDRPSRLTRAPSCDTLEGSVSEPGRPAAGIVVPGAERLSKGSKGSYRMPYS
uniref:Putative secreted protein n=1 Tax=Anopheles triannulatus TaxID=58253 RepID=A0A2M4B5K7_9DIPT